jgi:hypothetical protein
MTLAPLDADLLDLAIQLVEFGADGLGLGSSWISAEQVHGNLHRQPPRHEAAEERFDVLARPTHPGTTCTGRRWCAHCPPG